MYALIAALAMGAPVPQEKPVAVDTRGRVYYVDFSLELYGTPGFGSDPRHRYTLPVPEWLVKECGSVERAFARASGYHRDRIVGVVGPVVERQKKMQ